MKYIFFFAVLGISFAANTQPAEDFMEALRVEDFAEANRIFAKNLIDPDYASKNERIRGATPLWLAARRAQWDMVEFMLERGANVNSTPTAGDAMGTTPFWLAAKFKQWTLCNRMLDMGANVHAAPTTGVHGGGTVLLIAAHEHQWALAERMIALGADVNTSINAPEAANKGKTSLWYAAHYEQWPLVALIALTRPEANFKAAPAANSAETVAHLVEQNAPTWLKIVIELVGQQCWYASLLPKTLNQAVLTSIASPTNSRISCLPDELKWEIAQQLIWVNFPDLGEAPANLKDLIAKRIRMRLTQEKMRLPDHQYDLNEEFFTSTVADFSHEVVATQVLNNLSPIHLRDARKPADFSKDEAKSIRAKNAQLKRLKRFMLEAGRDYLGDLRILNKNERARLIAMLSNTSLSAINRKWIRAQFLDFANNPFEEAPVAKAEKPSLEHKRARVEEEASEQTRDLNKLKIRIRRPKIAVAPEGDLRGELTLTVIRDQPGLDRDQVNARVEEMMAEGPVPMDVDEENLIRGNFTAVENQVNAAATLRNAFLAAMMMAHVLSFGK